MYLWLAFILLLIFIYNFYSKLRSRHTIALHRSPTNVRRRHREVPAYRVENDTRKMLVM